MRARDGFPADSPVICTEASSTLLRLKGIQSRFEAGWTPKAENSDTNAIRDEICGAAPSLQATAMRAGGKSDDWNGHNRGSAVDLAPMHPLFCDIGLLNQRADRVAENEIIALNDQGPNSRRVA
jgi:hypothetical protein